MLDMSWGEVMVIGGVALIVIGPKDLPKALRTVGQMTTKVRRMAAEFQSQFSEAMREAELDEVRREVEGLNRQVATATASAFNPIQTIRDELKGAVETSPASPLPAAPAEMPLVEETGPSHQMEPVPATSPDPSPESPMPPPDVTGPGLESAGPVPLPGEPAGMVARGLDLGVPVAHPADPPPVPRPDDAKAVGAAT